MSKKNKEKPQTDAKVVKRKPRTKPNKKKTLKPGSKDGRPLKINDEIASKILSFIRAGNYVETAAAAAGLCKHTFYRWLRRGAEEKEGPFKSFCDAVERAMAEADVVDMGNIGRAANNGDWRASAWRLERRNPKHFGRTTEETERTVKVTVADQDGKKTTFTMHELYKGLKQQAEESDD